MKRALFVILIFLAGFFIHAFIFPNFLSNALNLNTLKNYVLTGKDTSANSSLSNNTFETKVNFVNFKFNPEKVWVRQGNYLEIINNDSKQLMLLISDDTLFTTPRPYGYKEQLKVMPTKKGAFYVYEKATGAKLIIVVN